MPDVNPFLDLDPAAAAAFSAQPATGAAPSSAGADAGVDYSSAPPLDALGGGPSKPAVQQGPTAGDVAKLRSAMTPAPAPGPAPDPNTMSDLDRTVLGLPPKMDTGVAGVRGVADGATLGWMDRLNALGAASPIPGKAPIGSDVGNGNAIDTILGGGRLLAEDVAPSIFGQGGHQAYDQEFAAQRAQDQAAKDQHPIALGAGELAGGVGGAFALPALTPFKGASLAGRAVAGAGNAATNGMIYGGVAGAGAVPDAGSMMQGATSGAATGALLAPALGAVATPFSMLRGLLAGHFQASSNPGALAQRVIARNVGESGGDLGQAAAQVKAMHDVGQTQYTPADALGEKLQGLPISIAQQPGPGQAPAREFLADRMAGATNADGQRPRVDKFAADFFGGDGSLATQQKLMAQRKAAADPLYTAARADPITMTPELQALVPQLQASGAMGHAARLARLEGKTVDVNTLEPWDYMQRALGDRIDMARSSGRNNEARIFKNLKDSLTGELDKQSPNFAAARAQYAGDSRMLEALETGKNVFRPGYTREQVAADMAGMTPGEQEMYRLGAGNSLREQMANADFTGKLPKDFGTNSAIAQKAKLVAPSQDAFDKLAARMQGEGDMMATNKATIGGSQTSRNQKANEAGDSKILDAAATGIGLAAHSGWIHVLQKGLRYAAKIDPTKRGAVLDEARKLLLNPDPVAAKALADKIAGLSLPKPAQSRIARALQPLIDQPKALPAPQEAEDQPGANPGARAAPAAGAVPPKSWRMIRNKLDGSMSLWNPQTGEIQAVTPAAQPGG